MVKKQNKEVLKKEAIEAVEETTEEGKDWKELEVSEKEAIEAVRGSRVSCIATSNR